MWRSSYCPSRRIDDAEVALEIDCCGHRDHAFTRLPEGVASYQCPKGCVASSCGRAEEVGQVFSVPISPNSKSFVHPLPHFWKSTSQFVQNVHHLKILKPELHESFPRARESDSDENFHDLQGLGLKHKTSKFVERALSQPCASTIWTLDLDVP